MQEVASRLPLALLCPQVVAETLKAGLLAVNVAGGGGSSGGGAQLDALLHLLVPVLVEVAAPPQGGAPATPLLADMSVKLLTHLAAASGPTAAAFRAAAGDLPAATKLRLQSALQQAAAAEAAQAAAAPVASGPMQRSAIKLNFAAFKK